MNNKNSGFTLIEVIISLLLLSIFIILLSSSVKLTSNISKKFLDFSDYEYAIMHKKLTDLYTDSSKFYLKGKNLYFENKKEDTEHKINFTSTKIYKSTKNPDETSPKGYSLLLNDIKEYSITKIERDEDIIISIKIIDRLDNARTIYLREKDEDKEKEEKEKKEKSEKIDDEKENLKAETNTSEIDNSEG